MQASQCSEETERSILLCRYPLALVVAPSMALSGRIWRSLSPTRSATRRQKVFVRFIADGGIAQKPFEIAGYADVDCVQVLGFPEGIADAEAESSGLRGSASPFRWMRFFLQS